jgi:uncharacterized protein
LTRLEISIIDTKQFQRLRYIKQTGPAYQLYPTALHTRFDHSLGTLHIAQRMADGIKQNETSPSLTARDVLMIRLVALLHDLVHLPFGHSLEDEGRLFEKKQWQSEIRQEIFFQPIATVIRNAVETSFNDAGMADEARRQADKLLDQIKRTLIAEEDGDVEGLEAPYVADIVGNTICADLLDYLERDRFFCGLSGGYDELIFFYMTLGIVDGKQRLVIRLFKPGKKEPETEIRPDVLSALIDLLRLRYSLGERVYYHHTKREASAMVIKMVSACLKAGVLNERKLCEHSDDSLLYVIGTLEGDPKSQTQSMHISIARKLQDYFSRRLLYKPAYEHAIEDRGNREKVNELIENWEYRYETEETFCDLLELEHGDVLIYAPSRKMGLKQADVIVQTPASLGIAETRTLRQLAQVEVQDPSLKEVIDILRAEDAILPKKHKVLWKLSIFVHPRILGTPKEAQAQAPFKEWFVMGEQRQLVQLMAERQGFVLDSEKISELAREVAKGVSSVVQASDSFSEREAKSLLTRYCDLTRTLLQRRK